MAQSRNGCYGQYTHNYLCLTKHLPIVVVFHYAGYMQSATRDHCYADVSAYKLVLVALLLAEISDELDIEPAVTKSAKEHEYAAI